jgi:hypothetical protein
MHRQIDSAPGQQDEMLLSQLHGAIIVSSCAPSSSRIPTTMNEVALIDRPDILLIDKLSAASGSMVYTSSGHS